MIIDAHLHLWEYQNGKINKKPVYSLGGGRSFVEGEIRQMLPPFMVDGRNEIEYLISNMDYAGVNGCVVTQEYMDGNQDDYLKLSKTKYPERMRICSLYEEKDDYCMDEFDGLKICASRLANQDLSRLHSVFSRVDKLDKFISIDLAEGSSQVAALEELITTYPNLRIAIGHFGMVGRKHWKEQIKLAKYKNVYIESGGITWLFHDEYYPYPSAIDAIIEAKNICGIEKLMWGSDYPRTMTAITYIMSFDFIQKTSRLSQDEKDRFLGGNAKHFYRFDEMKTLDKIKNMVE